MNKLFVSFVLATTSIFAQSKPLNRSDMIQAITSHIETYQSEAIVLGDELIEEKKDWCSGQRALGFATSGIGGLYSYSIYKNLIHADEHFFQRTVDVLFPEVLEVNPLHSRVAPYTFEPAKNFRYDRTLRNDGLHVRFTISGREVPSERYVIEGIYKESYSSGSRSTWLSPTNFQLKIMQDSFVNYKEAKSAGELLLGTYPLKQSSASMQWMTASWNIRAHFSKLDLPAQMRTAMPYLADIVTPQNIMRAKIVAGAGLVLLGISAMYFADAPSDQMQKTFLKLSRECFDSNYASDCVGRILNSVETPAIHEIFKLTQEMKSFN